MNILFSKEKKYAEIAYKKSFWHIRMFFVLKLFL